MSKLGNNLLFNVSEKTNILFNKTHKFNIEKENTKEVP